MGIKLSGPFPLPLITRHVDGRMFELMAPYKYIRDNGEIIDVPEGFFFDWASIPRCLWSIVGAPTGKYGPAALVHDFLCMHATWPRAKTDKIFLEALRDCGVYYLKRKMMYYAVRVYSFF